MPLTRAEREAIAARRLLSVLARHGAAIPRTLEQKISDAGPNGLRIDPHILIPVRNRLVERGEVVRINRHHRDWYALPDTPQALVDQRIAQQFEVLRLTLDNAFTRRLGDTLEIAVFRALREANLNSLGGFRGLTAAPTVAVCRKEEPPSIFRGRELSGNKRFDFLVGEAIWGGIECKNIREWLYPDRDEIKQLLRKSYELDIPPILIGRRIPYVTRRLLEPVGGIVWETRNQYYPPEHDNLAAQMKDKMSLGFFDILVTDYPGPNLTDFIQRIVPEELPSARARFDEFKDLIGGYALGELSYRSFAARVRRREQGQPEDRDAEEDLLPDEP